MTTERMAYTVAEVATMIGISPAAVYRAVEAGTLPHKRLCGGRGKGRILIPAAALGKWLAHPDEPQTVKQEKAIMTAISGRRREKKEVIACGVKSAAPRAPEGSARTVTGTSNAGPTS